MKIILSFLYISGILALGRLIPHPPNFTPILAAAIFAPYIINDRWFAMAVPLMAMFIGDVFIGFHPYMLWVYGAIAMSTVISRWAMQFGKYLPLATMTLVSSVLFYIVTNFAVWIMWDYYPNTIEGLIITIKPPSGELILKYSEDGKWMALEAQVKDVGTMKYVLVE